MREASCVLLWRRVDGVPHVYLALRSKEGNTVFPEHLECPGGRVEPGESPREAAYREAMEEADVDVESRLRWCGALQFHGAGPMNVLVHLFSCELRDDEFPRRMEPKKRGPWFLDSVVQPCNPLGAPITPATRALLTVAEFFA